MKQAKSQSTDLFTGVSEPDPKGEAKVKTSSDSLQVMNQEKRGSDESWQAWIFDLDDTLLDTSGELIPQASQRVCQFLVDQKIFVNQEDALAAWSAKKEILAGKALIQSLIVERAPSSSNCEKWIQEAYHIFRTPQLPPHLSLLPGGEELLRVAQEQMMLFLVTQGDIPTQIKKVELLKIANFFRQIYYVDPFRGENKTQAFQAILKQFQFEPQRVLSIGNRLDNEIESSKRLGMKTCYYPYGEHQGETPQCRHQEPDYVIHGLQKLQSFFLAEKQL